MSISFELLDVNSKEWKNVEKQVSQVSWVAGKSLAQKMCTNDFSDWEKVIIGKNEDGALISFCVVSKEDGLNDKSISPFIGYVFVSEEYRGNRLSEKLLQQAESYLRTEDFKSVYIVSGEDGLYEKYGYKKIGNCKTIYGHDENLFEKQLFN